MGNQQTLPQQNGGGQRYAVGGSVVVESAHVGGGGGRNTILKDKARRNAASALNDVEADYVKINGSERKIMVDMIHKFVQEEVIGCLKEKSPLFKELYRNLYFTGSYYDGLRVSDAKEFDLNVVLGYPKADKNVHLEFDNVAPGFAKMRVENELPVQLTRSEEMERTFRKHFVELRNGKLYMSRDKPKRYLESLLTQVLGDMVKRSFPDVAKVDFRKAGPAMNLIVTTKANDKIDVDLVLAFVFPIEMIQNKSISKELKRNQEFYQEGDNFFLIPKAPKNSTSAEFAWRVDFHDYEKRILHDKGCVKPVVRLLKLFRDRNQPMWKLSSYSLKTVVMQLRRDDPANQWLKKDQPQLFLAALKRLMRYLEEGSIPYVFDSRCNVLWNMTSAEKGNKRDWLKRNIPKLENAIGTDSCYDVWMGYFRPGLEAGMAAMTIR